MKRILLPIAILLFSVSSFANGLKIENIRYLSKADTKGDVFVVFDLHWKNAIGSADGRAFTGSTGDGNINSKNDDWPYNDAGKKGHGYRGGGFYHQRRSEHEFNPYSPIAYRRFGGWSGGDAHMAYGFRCAGNAP